MGKRKSPRNPKLSGALGDSTGFALQSPPEPHLFSKPRGSHKRRFWPPQATWPHPEMYLVVTTGEGVLPASDGWRPGMLRSTLQYTGEPHPRE